MSGPLETVRQHIAVNNVISPVGSEVVAERQGSYRGEVVRTSAENAKISQAAGDYAVSEALRTNLRTLGQRTVRQGQGTHMRATARIADFYDKLPNMPELDELQVLVDTLQSFSEMLELSGPAQKKRGWRERAERDSGDSLDGEPERGPTKDDVLRALQEFDGDVTHQFAALEIAREHFASERADAKLQNLLDAAMADFEKTEIARDVRAGFAAAQVAKRAAATLETDPATVRDTYRSMLREQQNMGQLFDTLAKFDLSKNLGEVIDVFMVAAGRDLAGTGPSTDDRFLHGLIAELGKLKKVRSVFEAGADFLRRTERILAPAERGLADPKQLASRLLNFCAKPTVNLADARLLLDPLEPASPESQVIFANGLRELHAEVPDDVMPSAEARLQQCAALGTLLNHVVAAEEAYYESREAAR